VVDGGNRAETIGDARGFEGYDNIEVTPWLHITPNFQIINPSDEQTDTAAIIGLRAKFTF
jgi:porin